MSRGNPRLRSCEEPVRNDEADEDKGDARRSGDVNGSLSLSYDGENRVHLARDQTAEWRFPSCLLRLRPPSSVRHGNGNPNPAHWTCQTRNSQGWNHPEKVWVPGRWSHYLKGEAADVDSKLMSCDKNSDETGNRASTLSRPFSEPRHGEPRTPPDDELLEFPKYGVLPMRPMRVW